MLQDYDVTSADYDECEFRSDQMSEVCEELERTVQSQQLQRSQAIENAATSEESRKVYRKYDINEKDAVSESLLKLRDIDSLSSTGSSIDGESMQQLRLRVSVLLHRYCGTSRGGLDCGDINVNAMLLGLRLGLALGDQ